MGIEASRSGTLAQCTSAMIIVHAGLVNPCTCSPLFHTKPRPEARFRANRIEIMPSSGRTKYREPPISLDVFKTRYRRTDPNANTTETRHHRQNAGAGRESACPGSDFNFDSDSSADFI